jgi:hypothetical protein
MLLITAPMPAPTAGLSRDRCVVADDESTFENAHVNVHHSFDRSRSRYHL